MERYYRRLVAAPESGQTAILFMLMIIGLVAFVGLAVDGGHTLNERRITQNAADASALSGIHYIASSDAPAEEQLLKVINQVVESNGVPDTDNTPGNEINDNVTVYYTDNRGNRMDTQPCYIVGDCPLGPVPSWAFGVEVNLKNQVETYFIGVIGQNELEIGADAVAVVRGGNTGGDLSDYSMVAFGQCDVGDKPFDVSTNNADFIGGVYSSSWFENRGDNNHYHGQVAYGTGGGAIDSADKEGEYEPDPPGVPIEAPVAGDPFDGLIAVEDFDCSTGSIGSAAGITCYDLSGVGGTITTKMLKDQGLLTEGNDPQLSTGLYYGGSNAFDFGEKGMTGEVTIVSSNTIKVGGEDVQLHGYMPDDTPVPNLLLYSSHTMDDPCQNFEEVDKDEIPVNLTQNTGKERPEIYHTGSKAKPQCLNLDNPLDCVRFGSNVFTGLIYAPGGRVATSGGATTYYGAIVAYTIRVNGGANRSGGDPEKVGSLFIYDDDLFPDTQRSIYLDK